MTSDDTVTESEREEVVASSSAAGDRFEDKYRLEKLIASGGMGVVLQATHVHLGRRVAVKLLSGSSDKIRQRFLREARLAGELRSPHVVRVLDYGFATDGTAYLVMDLLEGRTLKQRLAGGRVPFDEGLRLSREIVAALVDIHAAGIVHRDLKPSNVFLYTDSNGVEHVKIIDFGIAKRLRDELHASADPTLTAGGEVIGTLRYMAPEQLRSSGNVDARADVWSAGVVLYELFTGRHPFRAEKSSEVLQQVLEDAPIAPASSFAHDIPVVIDEVLTRCLRRDAHERISSARELLCTLPEPDVPALPAEVRSRRSRPPRLWPLALGAALVLLAGSGAYFAYASPPHSPLSAGLTPVVPQVVVPEKPVQARPSRAPPAPTASPSPSRRRAQPKPRARPASSPDPRWGDRH